ncbi:SPOR domain-containing protein [Aliiglaciecola sp. CAU 1673]|uniref:SPOR domain-containing protein n=1 Tax=Aliiglaciecola sp. CAU 1673 TaxID=3032595 RepID=UPI0023DBCBE1|nr:SPOR domain-containing protein [Aliiglaciecola sp. CAU 1673]MDF2180111.1 SPOR domain-containing protein [Aliiglaciecola sp. CAU 1673]
MAQRDYVARGRAKQTPPPKPPLPWIRIIITLGLILGFAYFLWHIKDSADTTPAANSKQPVQQQEQVDVLPKPPKEKWEFIEELPNRTVEVEVPEDTGPTRRYLLQCGSFREANQAETMRARLAFQGIESQVRPSEGKNGRWHRVVLGPYENKRAAEKDRHAIQRLGITTCQLWNWNLD